jgi:membrane associated rhomboid family serine protease
VALQGIGFVLLQNDPSGLERMVLLPDHIYHGELWRLLSFLAIPVAHSPIQLVFSLLFSYFIINSIESEWGEVKTTFYVLTSILLMVAFALIFDHPITQISDFYSSLFLAATALFPEQVIRIYFFIPVKMKVLGWLAIAFILYRLIQCEWMDRFFLLAIYSNYLLFFGPTILYRFKNWKRKRDFQKKYR